MTGNLPQDRLTATQLRLARSNPVNSVAATSNSIGFALPCRSKGACCGKLCPARLLLTHPVSDEGQNCRRSREPLNNSAHARFVS